MAKNRKDDSSNYEELYDDWLDDTYWDVDICGMKMNAKNVLKEMDPTAYRCWLNDFADSMDDEWVCDECWDTYDNELEAEECCEHLCDKCGEKMENRMVDVDGTNLVEQYVCLSCK